MVGDEMLNMDLNKIGPMAHSRTYLINKTVTSPVKQIALKPSHLTSKWNKT